MPTVDMTPKTVPPAVGPQARGSPQQLGAPNNTLRVRPPQRAVAQGGPPPPVTFPGHGEGTPQPQPATAQAAGGSPVAEAPQAVARKIRLGDFVQVAPDGGDWSGMTGMVISKVLIIDGFNVLFRPGAVGELQPHRLKMATVPDASV